MEGVSTVCKGKNQICDALRYLVAYVQFKKREKHPWRSVNFSKVAPYIANKVSY